MRRVQVLAVTLAAFTGCAGDSGESSSVVDGLVMCSDCTIHVAAIDTLETESELGIVPGFPADLEATPNGRVAATFLFSGEPLWFTDSGAITGRIGRTGEGPGEFSLAKILLPVPDSIVVFESIGRSTVLDLDSDQLRIVRPLPFQIRDAALASWPDRVVVTPFSPPRADTVPTLMIFDMSGEGPELVHVVESRPLEADDTPYRRHLAAGESNTFWTVDRATYRVVHRDSEGRTLNEIRRTPDWAPDGGGVSGYGPATEPPARMDAIHQDSLGRVWVLSRTPRDDWRDAWARRGITDLPEGDVAIDGPSSSELWNSRLEVFSAGLDSLLGSDIIPGVFDGFLSDGRLHRYNESEFGIPIIEMVEVSLGDRSGPGSS